MKSVELPLYLHLAARIEGTVRREVTTDGMAVTKITASGAHGLLLDAAEQNVRTWKLKRDKPQTFTVAFIDKLEKPQVFSFVNPTVLLELPNWVEIRTKMHPVETMEAH